MKNTIGIVGGMGPLATCDLFRKIIEVTEAGSDQEHVRVVIDSNDYHVARAAAMARHMRPGIGVSCCAAKNPAPLIVHSMLREALAVMKARLMGQM